MRFAHASALNPGSGATTWPWSGTRRTIFPGVRGIGPKRAAAALAGGHVLENLNDVVKQAWWGRYFDGRTEAALKARDLIRFVPDVQTSIRITGRESTPLPLAADLLRTIGVW